MLERICRRFPWLRPAVDVHRRVGAVGGGPLSSSVALAGFLSLFPLLLVGIAVLGFLSAGDVDFPDEVVEQLGLEGRAAREVVDVLDAAENSRRAASLVGLVGLAWGGLGVAGALEHALNATWQVTGRGVASRLVGAGWLLGAGLLFLGSMALGPLLNQLPGPAAAPTVIAGLVLDVALFLWMFTTLTNVRVPWRAHLPGAIVGGVGLELLKVVGAVYVPRLVASSSALYGSLGVVFAILAWLVLSSRLVVYAAAFNVVRYEDAHGTVTVEIEVPHIAGEVPLEADRGGAVSSAVADDGKPEGRHP
ncbi:MAG: YihY/virulence factor BrkB family protein [Acidimicrobiales bacterium]